MAQSIPPYSWNGDWQSDAKQPGLEVRQTDLNIKQPVDEAWPLPEEDRRSRRVCGLAPAVFCLVLVLAILVVGGAIGGGIGGYIATHPSSPTPTPDNSRGNGSTTTSTPAPGRTDPPLASCSSSYDGQFNLKIINATTTTDRDEGPMVCDTDNRFPCVETLISGALVDSAGDRSFIGNDNQLHGAEDPSDYHPKFTEFSICSNGTLAVGGSSLYYYCYSESWDGEGIFVKPKGERCYALYLTVAAI